MPPLLPGIPDIEIEAPEKLEAVLQEHFSPTIHITRVYPISGHLHSLYLVRISNGAQLLLKCSPRPTTPLLRREQIILGTEALTLSFLNKSAIPYVPTLIHYDAQGDILGRSFLIRTHLPGSTLEEIKAYLSAQDRKCIDRSLGLLASRIGQHCSDSFGPLSRVRHGRGKRSWKEAFVELLESLLRDSEDVFVNLPYAEIRYQVLRLSSTLEEIRLPQLLVIDLGQPSQVLVDPVTRRLCGITGFGNAIWGDVFMAEVFESPSPALLDGFGSSWAKNKTGKARQLLYSCYHCIHRIVVPYYRNDRDMTTEIEARRQLMKTLREMAAT